ncbi:MAG TPA: carbon storage regulator [Bryobacteraceae bacterium]|nr:carbon storage regulator [Bryobacteraceae bacterium]
MLVMSRREGETILIGDNIEIVIAHIGRSRVKVGIRAPRETQVIAREVKLVREENLSAARVGAGLSLSSILEKIHSPSSSFSAPNRRGK